MPEETTWSSFFDASAAMDKLWPAAHGDVVELGCGYGTFTLVAARRTRGIVTALDIDPDMVAHVRCKAEELGIANIRAVERDFIESDFGVAPGSQSHVMIYNLLHIEEPVALLRKAFTALDREGTLSVMHWRSDIPTPRGPPLAIRPTPEQCIEWLRQAGFTSIESVHLGDCCPFHYGVIAKGRGLSAIKG
ncbi:class I SAM-dependent methyltransferase [Dyella psychrodurans]|nr:class I SAM-dependent methyltransferase [Dyella psychrodurans]